MVSGAVLVRDEQRQRRVALVPETIDRRLKVYHTMTGLDFGEIICQALAEFLDARADQMAQFLEEETRRMRGQDR